MSPIDMINLLPRIHLSVSDIVGLLAGIFHDRYRCCGRIGSNPNIDKTDLQRGDNQLLSCFWRLCESTARGRGSIINAGHLLAVRHRPPGGSPGRYQRPSLRLLTSFRMIARSPAWRSWGAPLPPGTGGLPACLVDLNPSRLQRARIASTYYWLRASLLTASWMAAQTHSAP